MKVFYVNNAGGGFADQVEVESGTTVQAFFAERLPGSDPRDYMIRVNRQVTSAGQVLADGDRITITPTKIAGARVPGA